MAAAQDEVETIYSGRQTNYTPKNMHIPLELGWKRQVVYRFIPSIRNVTTDIYYWSPTGIRLRSMVEVEGYIRWTNDTSVLLEMFAFFIKGKVSTHKNEYEHWAKPAKSVKPHVPPVKANTSTREDEEDIEENVDEEDFDKADLDNEPMEVENPCHESKFELKNLPVLEINEKKNTSTREDEEDIDENVDEEDFDKADLDKEPMEVENPCRESKFELKNLPVLEINEEKNTSTRKDKEDIDENVDEEDSDNEPMEVENLRHEIKFELKNSPVLEIKAEKNTSTREDEEDLDKEPVEVENPCHEIKFELKNSPVLEIKAEKNTSTREDEEDLDIEPVEVENLGYKIKLEPRNSPVLENKEERNEKFFVKEETSMQAVQVADFGIGIGKDYLKMVGNPSSSDVKICVGGKFIIFCHSFILLARCPLAFQELKKQENDNKKYILNWSEISYNGASAFLKFLYAGVQPQSPCLGEVTKLAWRYNVQELLTVTL